MARSSIEMNLQNLSMPKICLISLIKIAEYRLTKKLDKQASQWKFHTSNDVCIKQTHDCTQQCEQQQN